MAKGGTKIVTSYKKGGRINNFRKGMPKNPFKGSKRGGRK